MKQKRIQIKLIHPILILLLIVSLIFVSSKSRTLATSSEIAMPKALEESSEFEQNSNSIDIVGVLSDNANTTKRKEVSIENRPIEYVTVYKENRLLPKDEKIVLQQGKAGLEEVHAIRTFENNELVQEDFIRNNLIENYTEEIIEIGTSELLAKYNAHIGDLLYLKDMVELKELSDNNSKSLCIINKYEDVKLLDLTNNWCKVDFKSNIGYIKSELLTSAFLNPEFTYENRKMKALEKLSFDMKLNEPSGLILSDFQKLVANEPKDIHKIFETNIETFYNIEQKYNINGVFLLAIGIHESAWGTSTIASGKNNLFGYGAYDRDPLNMALTFEDYSTGINHVAKNLAKNYLNIKDAQIYDGELAVGAYYNHPTLSGVNVRYASDIEWCNKIYKIMEYLYGKL